MSADEIESRDKAPDEAPIARVPHAAPEQPVEAPRRSRRARLRRWRKPLLYLVPLLVLALGAYLYLSGGRYVSTDNAYVHADNVTVSAEVSGPIETIAVHENEHVGKDQVLFRIDPKPFRVALDRAEAALRAEREQIGVLKAQYGQALEERKVAETNAAFAKREYDRQAALAKTKVASEAKLDAARHAYDLATQQVAVAGQQIAQIKAKLGGDPDAPAESQASYQQAKAAVADAALNLAHTEVRAPFAGIASNKPEVGEYVKAGEAVMSVVADNGVWIEANFKETDLTHVKPGDRVAVSVDTYPDREWRGTVESISQATGAVFSVIPPQNATGNWVKVVQRIAVRIALDETAGAPPLRAGMSTEVEIDTGSRHRFSRLVAAILPWKAEAAATKPQQVGARP